jgi:hypothetical protein
MQATGRAMWNASSIYVPTLVIAGEYDTWSFPQDREGLMRDLTNAPTKRSVLIKNATHFVPNSARSVGPGGAPDLAPELDRVLELSADKPRLHCEQVELLLLELLRALQRRAHHVGGVLEPCAVELDELGHGFSFLGARDYRSARARRGFA